MASREQLAAVWYGGTDFRLERRLVPEVGPHDVEVEVAVCGICGSDVHIVSGEFPMYSFPRILGHEYSGTVCQVGSEVTAVKPGDRVIVEPTQSCRACFYCREGYDLLCVNRDVFQGAFAERTVVPDFTVFKLPDGVSFEAGALTEPLSCALHGVTLAGVRLGDRVAVIGAGALGLLMLQLVKRAGAARILVSDPSAERRAMAERFGADVVIDPLTEDLAAAARDMTDGVGVDVALEAVGSRQTVADCLALPRRDGTAVLVGVAAPDVEVSFRPYDVYERQLTIKGSFIRQYNFRRAVELLPLLDLDALISHRFSLSQAKEALEHVRARKGVKTVISPT